MQEMIYKCDREREREGERGGETGGGSKHNTPLCFTCHPGKSRLSFSGITAGQQQVREPLNYSLLLNQVTQHTTATGCEEEDTPATPHYISAAQFTSLGRRMLPSIRC